VYEITYSEGVADDLGRLTATERAEILDRIEVQFKQTRNRKVLVGLLPPWDHVDAVWELRVGEYRVFYDVDHAQATVSIRAIRHKPPHKTTEEIL
jgi:mRNA-degrading endonuclease RelE of RelBE toxin-antitoxin system